MNTNPSQSSPYSGPPPEEEAVITAPVARYYAIVVGLGLTVLGVLGMIPAFTSGNVLFGLLYVTPAANMTHLLSGLAGLAVWLLHRNRFARAYAVLIALVYVVVFTIGNIRLGNLTESGSLPASEQLPYILSNGLHVTLMLTGALVAALASMQLGDRRTREDRSNQRWDYRSRTRIPSS
ncbi:MAG TPA: DUF4383 domain-containing protein [Ktedonobacterales bacterium]|jgi:hypothetical protein|nr:DUF4383 domain-containing protein [Ktedonobacterales bacterium]